MVTTHDQAKRICLAKQARTGGTRHLPKAVVRYVFRIYTLAPNTKLDMYRAYCR